jgi:hypothetical protein
VRSFLRILITFKDILVPWIGVDELRSSKILVMKASLGMNVLEAKSHQWFAAEKA